MILPGGQEDGKAFSFGLERETARWCDVAAHSFSTTVSSGGGLDTDMVWGGRALGVPPTA